MSILTSPLRMHAQPSAAGRQNLHRLLSIRGIVLTLQALALAWAQHQGNMELSLGPLVALLAINTALALATAWRLRRPWPVTDAELLGQLLADVLLLSLLLYWSGGSTNPFVSYYLVPLSISAAVLPRAHTWCLTGLCIGAYSLMLFYYQPLPWLAPGHHHHGGPLLSPHIVGMWASFSVSALLITYFVTRMAEALRSRDALLAREREMRLQEEQLLGLGALAAGTAHELGTPLAGVCVLAEDLQHALADHPTLAEDAQLLVQQTDSCRRILQNLARAAEPLRRGERQRLQAADYLETVLDHWRLLRPDGLATLSVQNSGLIEVDATLEQALINLLNNAHEASPGGIELSLSQQQGEVDISILDRGPGISPHIAEQLGTPFLSTKGEGRGLGLFLANASVERLGGRVLQQPRPGGGTITRVILPEACA